MLDVAVKTAQDGTCNVDRTKLLQEAAIMVQFSHENVVMLLVVVRNTENASSSTTIAWFMHLTCDVHEHIYTYTHTHTQAYTHNTHTHTQAYTHNTHTHTGIHRPFKADLQNGSESVITVFNRNSPIQICCIGSLQFCF